MIVKNRYRIVTDKYLGYEAQIRRWWFPFWTQLHDERGVCTNTHRSVASAEALIALHKAGGGSKQQVVKEVI